MAGHRLDRRKVKRHHSYTIDEAALTIGAARGTVRRWLTKGLPALRDRKPFLILGEDLAHYMAGRARPKRSCPPGTCYCVTYIIQGLCVAVACLLYVPRLGSTSATTGLMWELQAITAVVVGGTALRGGVGRIWGTVCGAFILEIVGNIMLLSNFISEYLIGAIQGAIIIIAMLVQRSLVRKS